MVRLYACAGTALCIFYFYCNYAGIRWLDFGDAKHKGPTVAGVHHK